DKTIAMNMRIYFLRSLPASAVSRMLSWWIGARPTRIRKQNWPPLTADIDAGSRGRASLDDRDRGRVDRQLYRQRILRAAIAGGILCSVLAYMVRVDFWMALAAFVLSLPQFVFVPLLSLTRRLAGS